MVVTPTTALLTTATPATVTPTTTNPTTQSHTTLVLTVHTTQNTTLITTRVDQKLTTCESLDVNPIQAIHAS